MKKIRLDTLIVEKGLIESRNKAQSLIMAGYVYVNGQKMDKCGTLVDQSISIDIKEPLKYVSRGGLKLEKARDHFHVNFIDKVVLDIGSSTGGFTDVALQSGAKRVHAVDVGVNLLHYSLMNNERVIKHEGVNFRYIDFSVINECADIIVCDVSFISIKKIIDKMLFFCKDNTELIFLIKPQFEAGKKEVGKKGILKDKAIHKLVLSDVIFSACECGFNFINLTESPIKGQKGNIEYLAYFRYNKNFIDRINREDLKYIIESTVNESSFNNCKTPCREY
jgi:23S rRNA (cytidine1920-2'-O)/16S rRNA (cytidine1409-2'-O)-methyltransferase